MDKIEKYFTVTKSQKEKIDAYKEETGMTLSAIVEKSVLSFVSAKDNPVTRRSKTARNKDFVGELCNIRQKVYLKENVVTVIDLLAKENNCNHTDIIISAISHIFE